MVNKKGFTLIELIIVIAVIAILATTVILVLNPATILQEARDSQRIADLGQMSSALGLYSATVTPIDLDGAGDGATSCWTHIDVDGGINAGCGGRHGAKNEVSSTSRVVDGTGWIPVNLTNISGGAPLSNWPVDPTNDTTYYYSYAVSGTNGTGYELNANMESARYGNGGTDDVESTDGGNSATLYEVGNDTGLDL